MSIELTMILGSLVGLMLVIAVLLTAIFTEVRKLRHSRDDADDD